MRGGKIFVPDAKDEPPNFAAHRLHLADMRWEMLSAREMHRRFVIGRSAGSACMLTEPGPEVFQPASVPHLWLPPEDRSVSRYHLSVQGVRVTFEVFSDIRVLVEGDLAPDLTEQLLAEIVENLALATSSPWTVQEVSLDRKDVDSL